MYLLAFLNLFIEQNLIPSTVRHPLFFIRAFTSFGREEFLTDYVILLLSLLQTHARLTSP